ncbi:hypothetical protein J2790_003696 [Paenarthrobacter nicotinovorans]|uniref:hypothetical protein n=1 Tax=Micrococcaceae TaxID=1268 RepID=UPI00087728AC|nr:MULTISPECIES: hypothetical protein [Micrococcaceae]MDR6438531.1 hypothetical protein [Paenarthrobacter nicotinovorans]SCZ60028.1 hypothetical protein SAMN02799638_02908 [Arthrobacter sp. UNCCL28]
MAQYISTVAVLAACWARNGAVVTSTFNEASVPLYPLGSSGPIIDTQQHSRQPHNRWTVTCPATLDN